MPQDLRITVAGQGAVAELRSLRAWLTSESALRGRVRLIQGQAAPDALGSLPEALVVALGPGGVATAAATVLIAWIRRRTGDVSVRVSRSDGAETEVTATHVRGLDAAAVREMVAEWSRSLEGGEEKPADGPEAGAYR